MRWSFAMLIFSIAQIGCGSSYNVSSSSNGERVSFSEFNAAVENERAEIVFKDDSTLYVQRIRTEPNGTSWIQPITGVRDTVPTHTIKRIILTNRARGALDGAGVGFLSGVAAGLLVAVPYVGAHSDDEFAGLAYVVFPAIGAGAGLLIGTIIGITSGHTYEYEFPNELEKR